MKATYVPILNWLPRYRREWLRFDVVAGLTASAVVIPKAMAYATVAGLPLEAGLCTALVPLLIYVALGTSRPLSYSVTGMMAILTAGELARVVPGGSASELVAAASTLALLAGGFLILARILRLGFLSNFISDPVLTGLKSAAGVIIIVDQVPKLLGFHIAKGHFLQKIASLVQAVPQTHVLTLVLAGITIALIIALEKLFPKFPAPLVAVVLGIGASWALGLEGKQVELVGEMRAGLPAFALPDLSLAQQLWPGALGIALMAFIDTITTGRAFVRHGDPRPDANQELLATGLANVAGSAFGAMPSAGGMSQTIVNTEAGARSQVAQLVTAGAVVVTVLFLTSAVALMPYATLAAVVVVATLGMVSPKEFRAILRIRSREFWWAIVTLVAVILLGTMNGIGVAVVVSMLTVLYQANHPPVYALCRKPGTDVFRCPSPEHPDDETFPGLLMVRTEGRLHSASAPNAGEGFTRLIEKTDARVVAIDCSAVPDIEYTALRMLTEVEERLREAGIELWLAALNPRVLQVIQRSPLGETLGHERMFFNLEQAVEAYQERAEQTEEMSPSR